MSRRVTTWAIVTAFCWLVVFPMVLFPANGDSGARCGRPVAEALAGGGCAEFAQRRLGALSVWLVITGAVTTAFLAQCALAGPNQPE
jgi:hypothetical protein